MLCTTTFYNNNIWFVVCMCHICTIVIISLTCLREIWTVLLHRMFKTVHISHRTLSYEPCDVISICHLQLLLLLLSLILLNICKYYNMFKRDIPTVFLHLPWVARRTLHIRHFLLWSKAGKDDPVGWIMPNVPWITLNVPWITPYRLIRPCWLIWWLAGVNTPTPTSTAS